MFANGQCDALKYNAIAYTASEYHEPERGKVISTFAN